jgi:hypothetical protein
MSSAPVKPICHVSIPRSGHHMLVSILSEVFEWGQFVHCESYDFGGCCRNLPCTRVSARAQEAFGTDRDLRLYLQKSHDMTDEFSVRPQQRFVGQLRHPLQATIGWLRWHQTPIPAAEIMQASVGFLVYYLRFFHKWIANERLPEVFRLRYEDLVSEPERQVRALLNWAGVAFDETRLQDAVAMQTAIDAHTGRSRAPGASLYQADDFLPLFGPLYARLLPRLAAFCPGLPYRLDPPAAHDGAVGEMLDEWIFSVDLRHQREWQIDLTDARRVVEHPSIQGRLGIPHAFGFGFSAPETPHGCWTDGDVCIVPFRACANATGLEVQLEHRAADVAFDRVDLELVANGHRCPCTHDDQHITGDGGRRRARFDLPPTSSLAAGVDVEGCLVIKFVNLLRVDVPGERRKLGRLLASMGFVLLDASASAVEP